MEHVDDVDGLAIESLEAFVHIVDLEVPFNSKDVHPSTFHEEHLSFRGVSSVRLVVHLDPLGLPVVVDGDDIED